MVTVNDPGGTVRGNNLDSVRRNNLSMVLEIVHRERAVSRSDLTRETGLNRSTVAALVGELTELGLVRESNPEGGARVGRPSPIVSPDPNCVAIAINPDIDAVTVGVVALGGVLLDRVRHDVDHVVTAAETVEIASAIIRELQTDVLRGRRVAGIGVALPGLVRASDGLVRWLPHLGWRDEPLTDALEAATGYPAFAGNDANVGAVAEHTFGAGIGVNDLVYLNGSASGIGGAVIAHGMPIGGDDGYAGEFGQNRPGVRDHADRRDVDGTLEDEVSRSRLLEVLGIGNVDEAEFADAVARSTDPRVYAELDRQLRVLSVAISNAVNVLNPRIVVLGGFLSAVLRHDPEGLAALVREQTLEVSFEDVSLVPAGLGSELLMIGAAQLPLQRLIDDPAQQREAVESA